MTEQRSTHPIRTETRALSNTGPLISVFQSNSFPLLTQLFAQIHISGICAGELIRHGWEAAMQAAGAHLVVVNLTAAEEKKAEKIAAQIAQHPRTNDPVAANHLGEAQVIAVALRPEYGDDILLLDELAARGIARQLNVRLSGFPGALLLGVQVGLLSPEELRERLEQCRVQGTHYSTGFIQQVYEMARKGRR